MKMKKLFLTLAFAVSLLSTAGCSGLSSEAKKMTGDYYISEVSNDVPVMELHGDGTIIQRAIVPGVLTYSVKGRWNVKNDSLIVKKNSAPFDIEGDSTLIGEIPPGMSKVIVAFNGVTLTLRQDGVDYVYFRRGHRD